MYTRRRFESTHGSFSACHTTTPNTIVAGPYTEYKPGDVVEIVGNSGRRWVWRVVEVLGAWLDSRSCSEASLWHRISKANSMFHEKNWWSRGVFMPFTRHVLLRCFMVLVDGPTRSRCFRQCASGHLANFVECLRRRPDECWADHMKRTGPIVARQLKKHDQPRLQTLAMRRVRTAAWQLVRSPNDAKVRRYRKESATWRCDEEWREAYIKLSKEDYRHSTQWKRTLPGRPTSWEQPFYAFLWGCLDFETQGMQYVG